MTTFLTMQKEQIKMQYQTKFALRDFAGKPLGYYLVDREDLGASNATTAVPDPSEHILVIDVSGSMCGDIADMRSTIEKLLTLEEFNNDALKVSLISYSSHGDCRIHFQKVTVAEVMAPGSKHLAEIRKLNVRGLTGISQALQVAETLIDDKVTTCISLHTDGYANDPSPYSEAQHLVAVANAIAQHPRAFCNTVAYRANCDFPLLTALANKLSGRCIQAQGIKQVYQALHDTTALLASKVAPVIEAGIGNADFVAFVSRSGQKILGGTESLKVRGVAESDDKLLFRYRKVTEADFNASSAPLDEGLPLLAFARVQVALGNLNLAKYAMITTRNKGLRQHARALVGSEVAAMTADLERHLFSDLTCAWATEYGLGATGPAILDVLGLLTEYQKSIRVNVKALASGYKRRGLKRVAGTRLADGTIEKPKYDLKPKGPQGEWIALSGVEINRANATANLRLVQDANLVAVPDGTVIPEVAGIPLDLKSFNNYTVVGDGVINVPVLPIRTSDKRCFQALKDKGLVTGEFNPEAQLDLDLSKLPVVGYDAQFDIPVGTFERLLRLTVVQKVLGGMLKEAAPPSLTPEQVTALKEHCLSPALYFSSPTCNPYADLNDAIAKGEVDTRVSYNVELGTLEITSAEKLKSGNAYLQRRFTRKDGQGKEIDKPTLDLALADGQWGVKALTAKTKLDAVDALCYPIYEAFLGTGNRPFLTELVVELGWDAADLHDLEIALGHLTGRCPEAAVETLTKLKGAVGRALDETYRTVVAPLAFYVGSTGLVPDAFGALALTAEQLLKAHPAVSLSKAEKEEGVFYEIPGGHLLTVTTSTENFSTEAGVKVASAL
ncbi:MAG: hypothetical protein A2Y38_19540 [Spirochaetes bacterium GWB1_59_5]|nr:MAG: hypothetical protein A2Y38_19540 [Spirochaetes bacterium GWB1_59_5]